MRTGWLVAWVLLAAVACAGFTGLGVWQMQRLGWKQALMTRVAQSQLLAPVPAPGPTEWPALTRETDEYRRLRVQGRYRPGLAVRVRASTALGRGHWVMAALQTSAGHWLIINRGFVPEDGGTTEGPVPETPVDEVGLLRLSEMPARLWQRNQPETGQWVTREVTAIAAAMGLQGPVAPYFVDLVEPSGVQAAAQAAPAWPRPGLTVLQFSNNHASYALTWFALAAAVLGAAGWWLREERRLRRCLASTRRAPEPTSAAAAVQRP